MISTRIQVLIIVVMCFCVAAIFRLLAQGKMDYKLGIAWTLVFGSVAALALSPRALARIAAFLGIASPVNMLFFFGFLFSTGILFSLSRRTSRLQSQMRALAQEAALAKLHAEKDSAE